MDGGERADADDLLQTVAPDALTHRRAPRVRGPASGLTPRFALEPPARLAAGMRPARTGGAHRPHARGAHPARARGAHRPPARRALRPPARAEATTAPRSPTRGPHAGTSKNNGRASTCTPAK